MPEQPPTRPRRSRSTAAVPQPPRPAAPLPVAVPVEKSPIAAARESLGLSRREFAMVIGRSYPLVCALEYASIASLSENLRESFTALNLPFDELAAAYAAHRTAKAAAAMRKVAARA